MKFRDLVDSVAFLFLKKKCYASVCQVASRDKCQEANLLEVGYFSHWRGFLLLPLRHLILNTDRNKIRN